MIISGVASVIIVSLIGLALSFINQRSINQFVVKIVTSFMLLSSTANVDKV